MTDSLFRSLIKDPPQCPIVVNGVEHQVPVQLSVAAALLYLGHLATRQHPVSGEPRAPFCHMGVCFECLVSIDGQHKQRACLRQITPYMCIETLMAGLN
ncbi:(2Fe-2S)-binding protein [Candidatus Njordibacter sp. Uisw_039]|jgi:succinate dehydrogenase/fumarate reductase-like Fe-S protein|uniref:(2Fe-2S)-binding protein n=1 Tax=Candidatus Njordibacter sp. Uisw_039 TaxID=3230972 RepID=UPI003A1EC5DB